MKIALALAIAALGVGVPSASATLVYETGTATGNRRTVDTGQFSGVSFSPAGDAIVYSRQPRDDYPQRADLFTVPVAGGPPTQITNDHHSVWPVWGPARIVFARERKPRRRG